MAKARDIPDGTGCEVVAGDHIVALYHVGGKFYALDGICPHAGGPLGQGRLNGCIVTCPWHGWQFDVSTGRHCLTATLTHPSWPVIVEGDDVIIDFP